MRPAALIPVVVAAVAVPALAATQPWDEFSGPPDSEKVAAVAPIPDPGKEASPTSEIPQVGLITYQTRRGLVCVAAGLVKDGYVGRAGRKGFHRLNAADAAGSCGDIAENLADFGGIGLAHEGQSEHDLDVTQSVIYGLTASSSTRVRVTWRDGRTETVSVAPTAAPESLQGAEGAFAVAGRPGTLSRDATLELLRPDGTLIHKFSF